ncbi:MAG: DUF420 domain-containing protein [Myxococcota bacterium]
MTTVSAPTDDRRPLAAIGLVSLGAFGFLIWLIYFNEGSREAGQVAMLPAVNASLNSLSALFLVLGYWMIRTRRIVAHRRFMVAAFASSSLFLVSYVIYHGLHGDTPFEGRGMVRPIYFAVLISHIVLSAVTLPLVFTSFYFSLTGQFFKHKAVSRFTFPIWLYVSVTGVVVFFMLKLFNPGIGIE